MSHVMAYDMTWLIHTCDMAHSCVRQDSVRVFLNVHFDFPSHLSYSHGIRHGCAHSATRTKSWRKCESVMSHLQMSRHVTRHVTRDSELRIQQHAHEVMAHRSMSHGTLVDESCHTSWHRRQDTPSCAFCNTRTKSVVINPCTYVHIILCARACVHILICVCRVYVYSIMCVCM